MRGKMRCRYLFISVLCFSGLKAQRRIIVDEIWKNQIFESPYLLKDSMNNFTKTNLEFHFEQPNFKRVQTPEKSQTFLFENKGIFVEKSWKMSGFFNLSHQKEYGLGYNLSEERTTEKSYLTPYYYYVPKKSDWKNQKLMFGANVSKSFFQDDLMTQLKLIGDWSTYARLSDPKPQMTNLDYSTEILLGKRIFGGLFSLKYGLEIRKKNLNYYYENPVLNHINYPETFVRFNEGFGNNYIYSQGQQENLFRQNKNHFGVEYFKKWDGYDLKMNYVYAHHEMKIYDGSFIDEEKERFLINQDVHLAEMIFHFEKENYFYTHRFFWKESKGNNYNHRTNYLSYREKEQNIGIETSFANREHSGNVSLVFQNLNLNDSSVKINRKTQNILLNMFWNINYQLSQNKNIEVKPFSEFVFPMSHEIDYQPFNSQNENDLVKNVIFPDIGYDTHSRMNLGLKISLNYQFRKKMIGFFVDFKNDYFLGKTLVSRNLNGGFSLNTGINFYY